MSKKVFFYCNIEIDLAILASVASLIKNINNDRELILILPAHPRIKDDRMSELYKFFDNVIKIPYYNIAGHILHFPKGIINSYMFNNNLKKIKLEPESLFFCFDVFKFTDVLTFNIAEKAKCKIVVLSAFIGKRFDKSKLYVKWHSTLIFYLYSLFISKPVKFLNCGIKTTNLSGYRVFSGKPNYTVKIETSSSILNPKIKSFDKLPFPLPILKNQILPADNSNPKLLMLVSSMHGERHPNYWSCVRNILKQLPKNINIFIKDHPQSISIAKNELKDFNVSYFEKKENMELLIIKNNISTILGHGSTGLITASWMGLNTYDYTDLLNYENSLNLYYRDYLEMGYNIIRLSEISQIVGITIVKKEIFKNTNNLILNQWKKLLNEIIINK